ncbi:MAG: polysaccharide pyruvyl transferase CsaB [Mycobacterium leprae]
MAKILVSGYYGFNNTGDEAVLTGIIRSTRELEPTTTFTVISGTVAQTRVLHGVDAVSRGAFREIWRIMGEVDLVLQGGGSLVQDRTSLKSLLYYLSILTMAKLRRKPVMIFAQGIGPVVTNTGRSVVPLVLNRVNQITVRDPESKETLRRLGVHRPAVVTADPALALGPSNPAEGLALLRQHGADPRPIIGVSVRPWKHQGQPMEPELARALDQMAREYGAQVVFLPMQYPHDVRAGAAVAGFMQERALVLEARFTPAQTMAMVAACNLFVGMRLHTLIFAALNGVPLVGLSYDPKNDSFLQRIGETAAGTTDHLNGDAVVEAARRVMADVPSFRAHMAEYMATMIPLARENARLALSLLKRREQP